MQPRTRLCLILCFAACLIAGLPAPAFAGTSPQPAILWNYTTPDNYLWTVAFSGDGNYIAAGGLDDNLYLFSQNGQLLWKKPLKDDVYGVGLSDNAEYIAAVDIPGASTLWLFDHGGKLLWKKPLLTDYRLSVLNTAISADGNRIVVGGYHDNTGQSGDIFLFDRSGNLLWNVTTPGFVNSVSISADGSKIAATNGGVKATGGVSDNWVYLYDQSGTLLWKKNPSSWEYARAAAISRDGSTIAMTTLDVGAQGKKNIYVYDASGNLLWDGATQSQGGSIAISRNGKYVVAAGGIDHYVHVFDAKGAGLWDLTFGQAPYSGTVQGVAVSPDGRYVAVSDASRKLYLIENPDAFTQQAVPAQKQVTAVAAGTPVQGADTQAVPQGSSGGSPVDGIVAFFKNLFHF